MASHSSGAYASLAFWMVATSQSNIGTLSKIEMLPSAAAELARLNVDIFFGAGPEASLAL